MMGTPVIPALRWELRGPGVQGHLPLHSEFEASLLLKKQSKLGDGGSYFNLST